MNKFLFLLIIPVIALLVLGGINVSKKVSWKEVTDGITWKKTENGLLAVKVDRTSEAYLRAGIQKNDILTAINKNPVSTKIDIQRNLWAASVSDRPVTYEINRPGFQFHPNFYLQRKKVNPIYFYLVFVGLTTIVISFVVFFNARGQTSPTYFFYYLLALTFASYNIFSPTGLMDRLDMVFHWLDKVAFLAFPPLLLHFFMFVPLRKRARKDRSTPVSLIYAPAVILLFARGGFLFPRRLWSDASALTFQGGLEKLELLHFAVFVLITLGVLSRSAMLAPKGPVKKHIRFIVYGLSIGVLPSLVFYSLPFIAGATPSTAAEITILLQALIPLSFSYSISRYRFVDLEVMLKKSATLIFSFFVIAFLYFIVSSQTRLFSENRLNAIVLGILAIILGSTLFTPLKKLFQALLDKAIYKRSYEYRKTLLFISKELSRERNLQTLSQSLLEAISNALSLRKVALLLVHEENPHHFLTLNSRGDGKPLPAEITINERMHRQMLEKDYISYSSPADARTLLESMEEFTPFGIFHFLPLKVENKVIGFLVMGKKQDGSFLSREDWELLTTVSGSAALALENAYLYNQESVRTMEMQRLKDYSENIIESLTVGVAVVDRSGTVIGWNRVLQDWLGISKESAIQKKLVDVLGVKTYSALFPTETQEDFRLLSETILQIGSGEERVFDIARTPLLDNALNPYGTIIVFEDITEKVSLQQQLLTSEKLASIGLLSAGVAHEINTPLTGISSYIQMLQKNLRDSHYAQILEKIEAQTDRVARIVKNLLSFARNPSASSFHRTNIKAILDEILSLIDYKLKNMHIRLDLDLSPLPPFYAQGERLQQVFINIILNALDAMPQGGTLKIKLSQADHRAIVRISDTGTGIKPEHLPHIFDPFFTTKGIGKGTGLGLSIGYAIIKEHEGYILVDSEPGKGTTFTIVLPLEREKAQDTKSPPLRK